MLVVRNQSQPRETRVWEEGGSAPHEWCLNTLRRCSLFTTGRWGGQQVPYQGSLQLTPLTVKQDTGTGRDITGARQREIAPHHQLFFLRNKIVLLHSLVKKLNSKNTNNSLINN